MTLAALTLNLREERMGLFNQLQAELDATAGRPRSAEEAAKIARIDARIDEIDAEIREMDARMTRELESGQLREAQLHLFGEHRVAKREMTEQEFLRSWLAGEIAGNALAYDNKPGIEVNLRGAMLERQLLRQGASPEEIRALAWDATSGSLVVPTTMARSLYEVMEANIAGFRIGAEQITTASGENLQLPKLKTHAVATQVAGQGTTLAGTDPIMDRVNVNVYKYGELVKVSNELISDAAFDVASFLGRDIGRALARVIDADLVVGTGTAEPTGMTVLAGAGTNAPVTTGGSLIAPTVEKFIDLQYSVVDAYRQEGAAWLMKDSVAGTLRKVRDGAGGTVGAFVWEPSLTAGLRTGEPDRFLGDPVYKDVNCAAAGSNATLATYGWFGEYALRTVGNPVIERNDSVYFATDEVGFRGKWRVGGNHRDVGALNNLVQNV